MIAQTPIFGFLTFARSALYPTYADAARVFSGLDPVGDQMLGGFVMKFTNMVASIAVIGTAFFKWSNKSGASSPVQAITN